MQKPTELARAFWQPRWQHSMGFRVSGWVFCVRVCVCQKHWLQKYTRYLNSISSSLVQFRISALL